MTRPATSNADQRLRVSDGAIAVALFLGAGALYAGFALRLAEGRLFEYFNLAFDFDASRVLALLAGSPPDPMGFKHPLMLYLRPLGLAVMAFDVPGKAAAAIVMAAVGAASTSLVFLFLRLALIARIEASALALLFSVTGTQLVTAIIPESYGFAGLSLVIVWIIAVLRLHAPERLRFASILAAAFAMGVTITNVIQPIIAEAALLLRHFDLRSAFRRMMRFGITLGIVMVLAALPIWWETLWGAAQDPVAALKAVWWLQTQGETTGPIKVVENFLAYSFVSPAFTVVPLPETTRMLDFRDWSFSPLGTVAVVGWLLFLAVGTVAGLAHPEYRRIALPIAVALLANIVFHLDFQYRGSLYIYAAHTHFLVFALAAGAAPWLATMPRLRLPYAAVVLALTVLTAIVNLQMAADFSTRFDVPDTSCPAPCS
jgi:hypothetical protein